MRLLGNFHELNEYGGTDVPSFSNTPWRLGKSTEIRILKTYTFNSLLKKPEFKEGSRGNISLDKLFEHVSIKNSIAERKFLLSTSDPK